MFETRAQKNTDDASKKVDDSSVVDSHLYELQASVALLTTQMQQLLFGQPSDEPGASDSSASSLPPLGFLPRQPLPVDNLKLDVPCFDGIDPPIAWIFKINQFFNYHQVLDTQHLTIASFYIKGPALG